MIRRGIVLGVFLTAILQAAVAQTQPAPQTARQALIETFFGKSGSLEKHLPEVTRAALEQARSASGGSMFDGVSMWAHMAQMGKTNLQTFDAGPTLLSFEDMNQRSKIEAIVDRDDLEGDGDSIEISFRSYKDGQLQPLGMSPKLIFLMKQEAAVWRIHEVTMSLRFSLVDPVFLKSIATAAPPRMAARFGEGPAVESNQWHATIGADEHVALSSMRMLLAAEKLYAQRYPAVGFTCSLSDLGGMGGGGEANEHQARVVEPRLAMGRKDGYVFALSGCTGTPGSQFKLTAVPGQQSTGSRTLCSDESGQIRAGENAQACLNSGTPVH